MKRCLRLIITLLLVAVTSLQLQAKKHPFVMEGKKWVYCDDYGNKTVTYVIHGDTIVSGEAFMKMFRSENGEEFTYFGAVQEQGKKVYIIYADEETKGLVYDFNDTPESHETLANGMILDVGLDCKQEYDSELYNRIRYTFPHSSDDPNMTIYISALEGFGGLEIDLLTRNVSETNSSLIACYENGEYLFNVYDTYSWDRHLWNSAVNSLVKEGKQWNYRAENFFGDGYDFEFFIEGDTLIGNKAYKKLYTIDEPRYNSSEPVYCGALREERTAEAIAVDFVRAGHENVELLYNFSPLLGDKFYYGEKYGTVTELDEITVRGIKRNRIKLVVTDEDSPWPNSEDATGYWVEGIGSSAGLLTPVDFISWGNSDHLLSVYENGDVVFTGSDFDGSSPTGISDSQYDVSAERMQGVYDLQGRRVMKMKSTENNSSFSTLRSSFPQKGVYIVSGRKYVVK